jgi:hypothetical protein
LLRLILVAWLALFPAIWAVYEYFGPSWVGFAILMFTLWKAFKTGLIMVGRAKPSKAAQAKMEKERKMQHYFYHCELNPTGFARLKSENFEGDLRQKTLSEAASLRASSAT